MNDPSEGSAVDDTMLSAEAIAPTSWVPAPLDYIRQQQYMHEQWLYMQHAQQASYSMAPQNFSWVPSIVWPEQAALIPQESQGHGGIIFQDETNTIASEMAHDHSQHDEYVIGDQIQQGVHAWPTTTDYIIVHVGGTGQSYTSICPSTHCSVSLDAGMWPAPLVVEPSAREVRLQRRHMGLPACVQAIAGSPQQRVSAPLMKTSTIGRQPQPQVDPDVQGTPGRQHANAAVSAPVHDASGSPFRRGDDGQRVPTDEHQDGQDVHTNQRTRVRDDVRNTLRKGKRVRELSYSYTK